MSSLGLSPLGDPSLPAVVTVGGLWLLSHTAGDEFVVLVRGPEAQQAATIAENILGRLRAQGISASVGAAWTLATDHRERATLLHVAEQAMHQAKAGGKGRAVITAVPAAPTGDASEAIPEPIAEEWTNPRRDFGPRDQAAVVLHRVRDDVRLAFPEEHSAAIADQRLQSGLRAGGRRVDHSDELHLSSLAGGLRLAPLTACTSPGRE